MTMDDALAALSALAQPTRLAAFRLLVQAGPDGLSVGALRERLGVPGATLTAHLNLLRRAGLVQDRRDGRVIQCSADFDRMQGLLGYLSEHCCAGSGQCDSLPTRC